MKEDVPNDRSESEGLLKAYELYYNHFKLLNDNFFKRVHVLMAAAEAGLVIFAVSTIGNILQSENHTPGAVFGVLAAFSCVGVTLGIFWASMGHRQIQLCELSCRGLRNLERKLRDKGIPFGIHLYEGWVFPPDATLVDKPKGVEGMTDFDEFVEEDGRRLRFGVEEEYPDEKGSWLHKRRWVQGGLKGLDTKFSYGFIFIWLVAAILSTVILWNNFICAACATLVFLLASLFLFLGLQLRGGSWKCFLIHIWILALSISAGLAGGEIYKIYE